MSLLTFIIIMHITEGLMGTALAISCCETSGHYDNLGGIIISNMVGGALTAICWAMYVTFRSVDKW